MAVETKYDTWGYYDPKTLQPLSTSYIDQLRQQSIDIANTANQVNKRKEVGFWDPRNWISEGFGVGGAVVGGILGGPVGAGIGGALGSGAGSWLEQQTIGNETDWGQVAGEAALGGIMGYGPIRAAKAVIGVPAKVLGVGAGKAAATGAATSLAQQAAVRAGRETLGQAGLASISARGGVKGALATAAQAGRGSSLGLVKGVQVAGKNPLTASSANSLYNFLTTTVGNTTGGPLKAALATETFKNSVGKQIGSEITKNATKVSSTALKNQFLKAASSSVMGDLSTSKAAQGIATNIAKAKTTADLWAVRKAIDNSIINWSKSTAASATNAQWLGGQARNIINESLKANHSGLSSLFTQFNKAATLEEILNKGVRGGMAATQGGLQSAALKAAPLRAVQRGASDIAARLAGENVPGRAGIIGGVRNLGRRSAQALAAPAQGIGLQEALTLARTSPRTLSMMGQQALGPAIGRVGLGVPIAREVTGIGQPPQLPSMQDLQLRQQELQQQALTPGQITAMEAQAAMSRSPYPPENLMADIQRDPQNADKYLAFYTSLNKALGYDTTGRPASTSGLNVTKLTSEDYANAVNGMNSLNLYAQELAKNPAAIDIGARIPGQEGLPFGLSSDISRITGTSTLNSLGYQMIESLLRIQTGAAAPESEVRRYMRMYLPQPGDSQATRVQKLQSLQSAYQNILDMAGNQSATTQTQDALTAALMGGQ